MEYRPITLCAFASGGFPAFLRDEAFLGEFAAAGNRLVVVCPEGGAPVAWPGDAADFALSEYDPSTTGPVAAVNRALAAHFDGRACDLVLVGGFDCAISCAQLDALRSCLYRLDRYSLASPRMELDGFLHLAEKDLAVAQGNLPAATRIPYPSGKFAYIRGVRFAVHGPFDESFASLDYAVRDFALSLDGYGYDSVMANHVLVKGATEGGAHGSAFDSDGASDELIAQRHPFSAPIAARFLQDEIGPVNRFMDELGYDGSRKWRVLLDFANLPPFHCGTSENQKALARYLQELFADVFEIHVFTNREGAAFHHLEDLCANVHYDEAELGTYDVGLLASHPSVIGELILLNDHCLRVVHTMLDCIMLRCDYLARWNPEISETIRLGLGNCDGIITISDFSTADCLEYFQDDVRITSTPVRRVYVSTDFGLSGIEAAPDLLGDIPFDDYVLLVGNHYRHKALAEAVGALTGAGENLVVFGAPAEGFPTGPNVHGIPSGMLSDAEVSELYRRSKAVVFPSVYEGFGLPIVVGLRAGKNVVVNANDLNRELAAGLLSEWRDSLFFFDDFRELPALVERAAAHVPGARPPYGRSWKDAVAEMGAFVEEVAQRPVDCDRLRTRWHTFACFRRQIEDVSRRERESCEQRLRERDETAAPPDPAPRQAGGLRSLLRSALAKTS